MRNFYFFLFLLFSATLNSQIHHWETIVAEDHQWHYFLPSSPIPDYWTTTAFSPSVWPSGPGGFGYSDGDDNTTISTTISCFQRIDFEVLSLDVIEQLMLAFDYDDAIVIYLNGEEIVRKNITSVGPPAFNQTADGESEAQLWQGGTTNKFFIGGTKIQELLVTGTNILAVQTHNANINSSDLTSRVWLYAGINDSSTNFEPLTPGFEAPILSSSNLPIMVIDTDQGIPNEPKIMARMGIISPINGQRCVLGDHFNEYEDWVGIEIRGSSSADVFPKKGYGLETRFADGENNNVSLFGMPEENDWVLHGPYSDKTLMRNVLTYRLGQQMTDWAPRTQFVELVLNGNYHGVYVFTEKIKRDDGRVDIAKLTETDLSGDELTGGYIVKIDKTTGGDTYAWSTDYLEFSTTFHTVNYIMDEPELEDTHPTQLSYIQNYVQGFEQAVMSSQFSHPTQGYQPYIDVSSFIDYILITEACKNVDGYRISTFLHKQKDSDGGKLVAGPIWDYNLGWGNADYCQGSNINGWQLDFNTICPSGGGGVPPFWARLTEDTQGFSSLMHCRWEELRAGPLHLDSLYTFIDEQALLLEESQERNFARWPVLGQYVWPNDFVGQSYQQEVDNLKTWIELRLEWMDGAMFGACITDTNTISDDSSILVFPNPAKNWVYVDVGEELVNKDLSIFNSQGQVVQKLRITTKRTPISINDWPKGVYFYSLFEEGKTTVSGSFIKS